MMTEEIVPYVQTQTSGHESTVGAHHRRHTIHSLIFHAVAGDSRFTAAPNGETELNILAFLQTLSFGILDASVIKFLATATITNPSTLPAIGCLGDLRMGATHQGQHCTTCHHNHHNCPGHFGMILLPHPVYNPMFIGLLLNVLQTLCVHCHRTRLSPWYILATQPLGRKVVGMWQMRRLKLLANVCSRLPCCSFCRMVSPIYKQQGLCITARYGTAPAVLDGDRPRCGSPALVPPFAVFVLLQQTPDEDLESLGFRVSTHPSSHPVGAILSVLPVLPPVSRPAMRTLNLKTGQPFVVEGRVFICAAHNQRSVIDTITTEYQTILNTAAALRTATDRQQIWQKYMDLHTAIERIMLDQNKGYLEVPAVLALFGGIPGKVGRPALHPSIPVVSIRSRWVGKSASVFVKKKRTDTDPRSHSSGGYG